MPRRVDIGMRPTVVEAKSRIGDLEVDLIIGKGHHGVVLTAADRKSKYAWLAALTGKTAAEMTREPIRLLEPQKDLVRTITGDNGKSSGGTRNWRKRWIRTTTSRCRTTRGSGG